MADNNKQQDKQINTNNTVVITPNTQINFRLKGFVSLILTILGLFVGFYKLAIQPAMEKSEKYQETLYKEQKHYMEAEFKDIRNAIRLNTKAIKDNNDRFRDLNQSIEEVSNSSGSFGYSPTESNEINETDENDLAEAN